MAKRKHPEIRCVVTFTEGWEQRVTQALVDLYYQRKREGKTIEQLTEAKKTT